MLVTQPLVMTQVTFPQLVQRKPSLTDTKLDARKSQPVLLLLETAFFVFFWWRENEGCLGRLKLLP